MKFSEQWLREWVDPALDTEALAAKRRLTIPFVKDVMDI